jgi:hypothetical protein
MTATKTNKTAIGARIHPLVKSLIALERKLNGGSEGEAIERLVYRASVSPEATELILKEASKDAQLSALVNALASKAQPGLKGGQNKTR